MLPYLLLTFNLNNLILRLIFLIFLVSDKTWNSPKRNFKININRAGKDGS